MSKKYFDYSFQIKRTKTTGIIFVIVIATVVVLFINWYNKKTVTTHIEKLQYKVVFGMNEFKAKDCKQSYKMNYKKSTCGTICINVIDQNENYLEELKTDMEKDEFIFQKIKSKKLGNRNWEFLQTKNNDPIINYYTISSDNLTYTLEYIDQSKSLESASQKKCDKIFKQMSNSMTLSN